MTQPLHITRKNTEYAFNGLFVRPFEATARASSPLLAGDGALGLAQGGGPGGEGCKILGKVL